jgi:hypothetical protein
LAAIAFSPRFSGCVEVCEEFFGVFYLGRKSRQIGSSGAICPLYRSAMLDQAPHTSERRRPLPNLDPSRRGDRRHRTITMARTDAQHARRAATACRDAQAAPEQCIRDGGMREERFRDPVRGAAGRDRRQGPTAGSAPASPRCCRRRARTGGIGDPRRHQRCQSSTTAGSPGSRSTGGKSGQACRPVKPIERGRIDELDFGSPNLGKAFETAADTPIHDLRATTRRRPGLWNRL